MVKNNPSLFGTTTSVKFALDDDVDSFLRGYIKRETPENERRISDKSIQFIDKLNEEGRISYEFSDYILSGSASGNAEMAGIKGAFIGSMLTLSVCLLIAFPLGVATAVYLEEIAKKNRITEFIEVNINNLAAVPSVVFGIMGLAIFISVFGMPRSIPLVGGMVLALMTLPTIIISSRAAIRAVPPSVRDAAYGIGASKIQVIFHHVIPLALPGMLTGTIIGMAQALGETAPLLMIGMVAFIVDVPNSVLDPGTVLPVQIFMWADFAERMFIQKTSAAIIVLLGFLISMNALAVYLRKKLERRW
jgi:phosphate transport system permease protein